MIAASPPPQRPPIVPVSDDHLPEPHAAVTEAADEAEMPLPSDPRTCFLGGLFALGALAALYVASSIILPVVLAASDPCFYEVLCMVQRSVQAGFDVFKSSILIVLCNLHHHLGGSVGI